MADCKDCKYENSTDIKIHLDKCTHCKRAYHSEEDRDIHEDLYKKIITNADRIRSMTDEGLAEFIATNEICVYDHGKDDIDDILKWLQSEVEE